MNLFSRFVQFKIVKNTSALAIGQVVGRVLTVIYVAALARYVGDEGIGQISIATSLNGLLVLLVGPGLEVLLARDVAADQGKASAYLSNTLVMRGLLGIPFFGLVMLVSHLAGYAVDTVAIVYVYTLVYLLDALSAVVAATFQAYERMEYVGAAEVSRNLVNVLLSLLGIALQWSLLAIAWMSAVASLFKLIFLLVNLQMRFVRPELKFDRRLSKTIFISSMPFALLLILHTGQTMFGPFVISLFYSEAAVGLYSAANTLIVMILMIPMSFSRAIFPTFSYLHAHDTAMLQSFYQVCFKFLLVLGFPLGLGTMLVGSHAIEFVYGKGFDGATPILAILALFLFTIVGYSNGPLLNSTGQQNFFAWTEAVAVLTNVLGSLILVPYVGPIGAAIAFVASGTGTFFVHSHACHRQLGIALPWFTTVRVGLATALMGVAVQAALWSGIYWLVVTLLIAPAAYVAALLLLGIVKRDELKLLAGGGANTSAGLPAEETLPT